MNRPTGVEVINVTNEDGRHLVLVPMKPRGFAKVDRKDWERLEQIGLPKLWILNKGVRVGIGGVSGNLLTVARVIVGAGPGQAVFFADGDPTNLTRQNLVLKQDGRGKRNDLILALEWATKVKARETAKDAPKVPPMSFARDPLPTLQAVSHAAL